jgi:diguanylate cyclase (GGDEF)-like protein
MQTAGQLAGQLPERVQADMTRRGIAATGPAAGGDTGLGRGYRLGLLATAALLFLTALPQAVPISGAEIGVTAVLLGCAVVNIELGRRAERGRAGANRLSKGLSAWPFAAALLLPAAYPPLVTLVIYTVAGARSMRMPLSRWAGSGAILILAAAAAGKARTAVHTTLPGASGFDLGGPVAATVTDFTAVLTAGAVFLAVEAALLGVAARVLHTDAEWHLRRALSRPGFYATELAVLASGAVTAGLLSASPFLLLLALPQFALLQLAVLHDALRVQASTDSKTGLLSHAAWMQAAGTELARAGARGQHVAVLLLDLDHFKAVNDTHGHLVGDQVLQAVAGALRSEVRARDVLGRFGGEEFAVAAPVAGPAEAADVAERLRARIAGLSLPLAQQQVTVSVGTCVLGPQVSDQTLPAALAAADAALYEAKGAGRNTTCLTHLTRANHPQR